MNKHYLLTALCFSLVGGFASAQTTIPDLAGEWILNNLLLPGEVPEIQQGSVSRIPLQGTGSGATVGDFPNFIEYEVISVGVDATGNLEATILESADAVEIGQNLGGTATINDKGFLVIDVGEGESFSYAINAGGSLMMNIFRNSFSDQLGNVFYDFDIDILTRAPETLAVGDLAGNWTFYGTFITDVWNNVDIDPGIPVVVSADGTATATVPDEGTINFNMSVTPTNGKVTLDFGEGETEDYFINSAKDVMVRMNRAEDTDFDPQSVPADLGMITTQWDYNANVVVREPESLELADLVGTWYVFAYFLDTQYFNDDPFNDPPSETFEPFGTFEWSGRELLRIVVSETGRVDATVVRAERGDTPGHTITGTVEIVDGKPQFNMSDDDGAFTFPMTINASKDFMVSYMTEDPGGTGTEFLTNDLLFALKRNPADLGIWDRTPGAAAGSWVRLDWFGTVYLTDEGSGWVYHEVHGWVYIVGRSFGGFWVWLPGLTPEGNPTGVALWTSQRIYPWFLRPNDESQGNNPAPGYSWVYFAESYFEETSELWFRDLFGEEWIQATPLRPPVID